MTSVLFMGYHSLGTACLRALLECPQADVKALLTHHDNPAENVWFETPRHVAEAAGIPVHYPEDLSTDRAVRMMKSMAPDIIISVYYRLMVPEEVLRIPPMEAVNLHGSLLPGYRGRAPVNWVLVNGESQTGMTLHYMVKAPDAGDIIDQVAVPVSIYDSARSLFDKMNAAGSDLFRCNLAGLLAGTNDRKPQDHSLATYFGGRRPEDGRIDWSDSANAVYNLVRAVTRPYPGAFSLLPGSLKLTVWWAFPVRGGGPRPDAEPGTAFLHKGEAFAACGGGSCLRLIDVEESGAGENVTGANALPARDWLELQQDGEINLL
ncbi:MAG: formyltransferase [Planctomycetes bacterium]|nr:formyltransferase [Planctomycetota bacterium]